MFEHNESVNIMKRKASLEKVKPEKKKDEHKQKIENVRTWLFSLWSLEKIEISVCINLLPSRNIEAVAKRCSLKKVFLEIWQNSQENTCARVSF